MKTAILGMDHPTAALVGYIVPIFAIVVAATEPRDPQRRWVRFHAFQSILLWAAIGVVLKIVGAIFMAIAYVLGVVASLLWLAAFGGMIFLGLKAKSGECPKLPFVGDPAERLA